MQTPAKGGSSRQFPKVVKASASIKIEKHEGINYTGIMALAAVSKHKRSSIKTRETPNTLDIAIAASDVTALRASINAVLRDLQVIVSTKQEFHKSLKSKGI